MTTCFSRHFCIKKKILSCILSVCSEQRGMRWYSILFCFFWSMSIIGLQTANCKHLCWVSSHQRWLNGLPLHCLHPVMNSDNHSQSCSFYEVWVQVLKVPYYEKLTFSGIWCYFGSMVLPHSYKCWKKRKKRPSVHFWVRHRFLTVYPCSFQMSKSYLASVSNVTDWSFEYPHYPVPSQHTYSVFTHQVQHYLLRDLQLCYRKQHAATQIAKDINSMLDFGQTGYFCLRLKNICWCNV